MVADAPVGSKGLGSAPRGSGPMDLGSLGPELLAPAGNWDCVRAAVENGADAVYFGLDRFNARMRADNFTRADLPELMAFLHRRGVRGYLTLNTLVFPTELAAATEYLRTAIAAGVDAAIVQDVGICRLIRHLSPDFPIHASTQMTVTSGAGVAFARSLGCNLVVLARECSIAEIEKIQALQGEAGTEIPLEVFVHGALCVAYSGQCLTSEALGGRSANRGECAQACRMTYDLVVDGEVVDLGDRRYLLSPQDLSGLPVLESLVRSGVRSLKVEGRLKSPDYVASVTRVYRQALDRAIAAVLTPPTIPDEADPETVEFPKPAIGRTETATGRSPRYELEMAFSRGLFTGWFEGIDNQTLVHGRYGKKRGVFLGTVERSQGGRLWISAKTPNGAPIAAGDGIVLVPPSRSSGGPRDREVGGRIYGIVSQGKSIGIELGRDVPIGRIKPGWQVWKTSDPHLEKELRQTFAGEVPKWRRPVVIAVTGHLGATLTVILQDGAGRRVKAQSTIALVAAQDHPLTSQTLGQQLGRLGNTPFYLAKLTTAELEPGLMLPTSELNRLRRQLVADLEDLRSRPPAWQLHRDRPWQDLLPQPQSHRQREPDTDPADRLVALSRSLDQLTAALATGVKFHYCEFEDPRHYRQAVDLVQNHDQNRNGDREIWLAPPRIFKEGERWILNQVRQDGATGYLVRNYDHLDFFRGDRAIGDFSLNVANPITARHFIEVHGLEALTAAYDLNADQLCSLLDRCPAHWFEVTLHQHVPMFHMEHCVFCAFLSDGKDYRDCGRPCDRHDVTLRDRAGVEHQLKADAGCRNTLFNGTAQTGAEAIRHLLPRGVRRFRIEFTTEGPEQVTRTLREYQRLLRGQQSGEQLWKRLKVQNQLGLTRGTLGTEDASA